MITKHGVTENVTREGEMFVIATQHPTTSVFFFFFSVIFFFLLGARNTQQGIDCKHEMFVIAQHTDEVCFFFFSWRAEHQTGDRLQAGGGVLRFYLRGATYRVQQRRYLCGRTVCGRGRGNDRQHLLHEPQVRSVLLEVPGTKKTSLKCDVLTSCVLLGGM